MKIVNIIVTSQNGGAEQVFVDYSVALRNLGHEVTAVVKNDAPYAGKVLELGFKVKKITNHFGYHDFFAIKKLQKILQESNADAVFAHAGRAMVIARKAIKKIKNKKIFLISVNHSMNVKRSIGSDIVLSVNRPIFFRTIDAGQSENRSFVMPNVIETADAIAVAPKVNLLKKDVIVLGGMGRLDKAKGFHHTIKAIKKLEKISDKKFIFKLAGSGLCEPFLRNLTKELNLEDRVEFLGWVQDKKSFFDSIDIFCMTSERETFGLVLLEAMKYGKPIISTNADGPKEILRNEFDGLMIALEPLDNIEHSIAEAVIRMVSEKDLANKLVENSLITLRGKFSFEALEERMKEIVGRIL